ncbi:hypothetical protein IEO21_09035 [Rhodonia placenta]|uniref:Transmembrane protein n=1 Tax=Rhodonia placenta TaxID=104341 RepID=A0A8H7NVA7_9APHY|nr:hypothetical protein IEO21_09035 [Postia placenta]
MNYTLDDASPSLTFSHGWGIQNASEPDLDRYFHHTFHVAENDGATMNFSFLGSYTFVAIYGSKGPGHASYSVQVDDAILPNQSAYASTPQFQQLLFQRALAPTNSSQHFVQITAQFDGASQPWLDVDFVTIGDAGSAADTTAPVATVTPPFGTGASTSVSSPSATPTSASSRSSTTTPTILAVVFGALIGVALLLILAYFGFRYFSERRRPADRSFPYASASASASKRSGVDDPSMSQYPSAAQTTPQRPLVRGLINGSTYSASTHAQSLSYARSLASPVTGASAGGYAHVPLHAPGHDAAAEDAGAPAHEPRRAGTPVRALFSGSPIRFNRAHKGDADSMRTDFLQV